MVERKDTKMQVTFLPINKKILIDESITVREAAEKLGIFLSLPCGGNGTCGKCKVILTKGSREQVTENEKKMLLEEELDRGVRLACCHKIVSDTCVILPKELMVGEKDWEWIWYEKEFKSGKKFVAALDIGTTTIVISFLDMETGKRVAQASGLNPQIPFGADVISRISYSMQREENRTKLHNLLVGYCEKIFRLFVEKTGGKIIRAVAAGNTAMSCFLTGQSTEGLQRAENSIFKASKIEMRGVETALLPGIGGHVGGDTFACILTADLKKRKGINLLVDIGTNGEIVLSVDGKMTACSAAAGPAFEGAGLYYGMKAQKGAVTGVRLIGDKVELNVLGGGKPEGICGSGYIDLMAELLRQRMVDKTGRMLEEKSKLFRKDKDGLSFVLYEEQRKNRIEITQKDIREIQLAKSAIFSGIKALLHFKHIKMEEIDHIYLAGNFGNHINIEHATEIGLLPGGEKNWFVFLGNASLKGAEQAVIENYSTEELFNIRDSIEYFNLAENEYFKKEFIEQLNFGKLYEN